MSRRTVGRLTVLGLIASSIAIVPATATAAAKQQRACYTATTFRAVSSASACRGAEAFIAWARHGLTRNGEVTGGTRPKNALTVTGDTGARGPLVSTRAIRGAAGLPGLRGVAGDSGPKGDPGSPGSPGAPGQAGPQGEQGLRGVTGDTGPRGEKGDQGDKGGPGDTGPQGNQGLAGAQGLVGLNGADGATGPAGAVGLAGPQGADGPQGAQGLQGPPGLDGAQGPPGLDGATGAPGLNGAPGATGPAGPVTGFRRTSLPSVILQSPAAPVATVAPTPGSYIGGVTTTITGGLLAASVACTLSDGAEVLGTAATVVGGDAGPAVAKVSIQLGLFSATGADLTFACSSDQPDTAASNTVLAGISLDAIAESP